MEHKTFTFMIACLLSLAPTVSHADTLPASRTLFATVENTRLRFEAPEGMCFADRTRPAGRDMLEAIDAALAEKNEDRLLGLFMPCDSLSSPGNPALREGRVPSFGLILWPHKIAAAAPHDTPEHYLNWRCASLSESLALSLPGWLKDADPLRESGDTVDEPSLDADFRDNGDALIVSYVQHVSAQAQPIQAVGAVGITLLSNQPIEIITRHNPVGGVADTAAAGQFMDDFTALQARLNE